MESSVKLELKSTKSNKKLIYLICHYGYYEKINGKKVYKPFKYSTGLTIESNYWDATMQLPNKHFKSKFGKELEVKLVNIIHAFHKAYNKFDQEDITPTHDQLRHELKVRLNKIKPC